MTGQRAGSRLFWGAIVVLSAAVSAQAGTEEPFIEQALTRGVNYTLGTNFNQYGAGLAFSDLDADGDPDLVLMGATTGKIAIYQNNGSGTFADRSAASGIPWTTNMCGISTADYNADGYPDIFLTRWLGSTNILYRNNGNMTFTDVSAASGVNSLGAATSSCWGDYNADGWPDLYVCYRTLEEGDTVQNQLYRNNGDGTFTDVAASLGVQVFNEPTLVCTFIDYDNDTDPDLYLGTDKGSAGVFGNHLFRNDGGTFTEVTGPAGAVAHVDCMGIAIGDVDDNGYHDLFMTNIPQGGHKLLMGSSSGVFTDETIAAGVQVFEYGWATLFWDYNNDRNQDLFICHAGYQNRLFRHPGSFPFEDVSAAMNINYNGQTYACAVADVDMDGDLDLAIASSLVRVRLYINQEGDNRHWLKLHVVGRGADTQALGAQARVTHQGHTQLREVFAGANHRSDNERTLHFGIGSVGGYADRIEVRWPNSTVRRVLTGYPVDHTWTVYPPSRLGDANANGVIEPAEVAAAVQIMLAHAGGEIDPGEEIYDMDGDCDVDRNDIASMILASRRAGGSSHAAPGPVEP